MKNLKAIDNYKQQAPDVHLPYMVRHLDNQISVKFLNSWTILK